MNEPSNGTPAPDGTQAQRQNGLAAMDLRDLARRYAVVILVVTLTLTLSVASEAFLRPQNLLNILSQIAPLAIIASAGTLVIIAGGFDLSTGAIFGLAAVTSAWTAVNIDPLVGMLVGPGVGLSLGLLNGIVITYFAVHSFLATLATSLVYRGLAIFVSGGFLIPVASETFRVVGQGSIGPVNNAVFILIGWITLMGFVLRFTTMGRYVYAVGGNPEAAELSGISVSRITIFTFALSGLAAGIAGLISTSKIATGQATAGSGLELQAIAAVVLGGTSIMGGEGAVWRSVLGVLLLALIANGFNLLNADPFLRDLTTGVVIIFAVALSARRRG
jgi:ribose transport system permease protein